MGDEIAITQMDTLWFAAGIGGAPLYVDDRRQDDNLGAPDNNRGRAERQPARVRGPADDRSVRAVISTRVETRVGNGTRAPTFTTVPYTDTKRDTSWAWEKSMLSLANSARIA